MRWSEDFYRPVFSPFGDFLLRENGAPPWCAYSSVPCTPCSCVLHWIQVELVQSRVSELLG